MGRQNDHFTMVCQDDIAFLKSSVSDILSYRVRNASPGAQTNAASAMLWAGLLIGAGYVSGEALEQAVSEGWGQWSVGLLVLFLAMATLAWRRSARRADKPIEA